eukprot:COSAG02_NODE_971_length_15551_cov_4.415157_12_plen_192_part_00
MRADVFQSLQTCAHHPAALCRQLKRARPAAWHMPRSLMLPGSCAHALVCHFLGGRAMLVVAPGSTSHGRAGRGVSSGGLPFVEATGGSTVVHSILEAIGCPANNEHCCRCRRTSDQSHVAELRITDCRRQSTDGDGSSSCGRKHGEFGRMEVFECQNDRDSRYSQSKIRSKTIQFLLEKLMCSAHVASEHR